jgi:hypothetical protein
MKVCLKSHLNNKQWIEGGLEHLAHSGFGAFHQEHPHSISLQSFALSKQGQTDIGGAVAQYKHTAMRLPRYPTAIRTIKIKGHGCFGSTDVPNVSFVCAKQVTALGKVEVQQC